MFLAPTLGSFVNSHSLRRGHTIRVLLVQRERWPRPILLDLLVTECFAQFDIGEDQVEHETVAARRGHGAEEELAPQIAVFPVRTVAEAQM